MKKLYKKISVPKNLTQITHFDVNEEVHPSDVDLSVSAVKRIWTHVEELYKTGMNPAIAFCLRKNGEVVMNRTIGYIDDTLQPEKDKAEVITPNDPICLFSASKAITGFLVHLLAEDGKLSLEDYVVDYLPEFAPQGKDKITIAHLLSHKAGIPMPKNHNLDPYQIFDTDSVYQILCEAEPKYEVGAKQAYHAITSGFILGRLIEKVSGMSLRAFLAERLQKPLGAHYLNYGVEKTDRSRVAKHTMTGLAPMGMNLYIKHLIGTDLKTIIEISNDERYMDAVIPAANIYATAEEIGRFYQMLLNGGEYKGKRICSPETVAKATQSVHGLKWDATLLVPMNYSNGFMLGVKPLGLFGSQAENAYGHLGFTGVLTWADPDRDISVSLLITGKSLLGAHLMPWLRVINSVSVECSKNRGYKERIKDHCLNKMQK